MPFDLSEDQLIATEKELAATFPKSYRSKMKRANGGSVEAADDVWELIPIRDVSDRKRLSRTTNHVLLETALSLSGDPGPRMLAPWHRTVLETPSSFLGVAQRLNQRYLCGDTKMDHLSSLPMIFRPCETPNKALRG
ncbi:MAG: SMI1/KNR4 family protein [Nitrososphaerales archaeon]